MAKHNTINVALSITTLDAELAHTMEPRTSPPASRLKAIEKLAAAGVPTTVMVAPIVPGLNDSEIPAILAAAANAGAGEARFTMLRLPWAVKPIFLDWLARTQPEKQAKIESRIRATRGGKLNNSDFGQRMRGTGAIAEQIEQAFRVFAKKYGLDRKRPPLNAANFRPPRPTSGQLRLF
jgi:DNA repair photolyase